MVHWLCQVQDSGAARITRKKKVKQSRILGDDQPMMSIGLKMENCLPPNSLYYTTDEENHDEASKFGGTICQTNLCGWWLAVWDSKCLQPLKPRDHPKHGFCLIQKSPNMISLPRFVCHWSVDFTKQNSEISPRAPNHLKHVMFIWKTTGIRTPRTNPIRVPWASWRLDLRRDAQCAKGLNWNHRLLCWSIWVYPVYPHHSPLMIWMAISIEKLWKTCDSSSKYHQCCGFSTKIQTGPGISEH